MLTLPFQVLHLPPHQSLSGSWMTLIYGNGDNLLSRGLVFDLLMVRGLSISLIDCFLLLSPSLTGSPDWPSVLTSKDPALPLLHISCLSHHFS